ncbi:MAG: DUF3795 domain-containing protein [Pelolinea sp.]|jgi:hypothetical protein|nr:DUF3795 domain-containing protein [Pelolinea sp.]
MEKELIAPCGMNCGLCRSFLRSENSCPGCLSGRVVNQVCIHCPIKQCKKRRGEYCFDCDSFPCERIQRLDARYRTKYGMSEIENLKTIQEKGIDLFLEQEEQRWVNEEGTFCVHDKKRYP